MTQEVPPNLQPRTDGSKVPGLNLDTLTRVSFTFRSTIQEENLRPVDVANILESDFIERESGKAISQEDLRFMKIVEEGIHQQNDGHFALPLPFKGERPKLPNNKRSAELRLQHLKRRFKRDDKYREDYQAFMSDIIEKGEAEEAPSPSNGDRTVWYIPHHGVYHPNKPGKIRVVFDCAAKYRSTSLNDHLLQGPDQLNALVGVLCRFRTEPIAILCDIERMYHRFRVNEDDRDYLRFLWWPGEDLNEEPKEYRMKVHIFGAVSSPGCAIFALKFIAERYKHLGLEASRFISRNFYMDDGLTSVADVQSSIELIHASRAICAKGNLRLHKFASNDRKVIETIPRSERAKDLVDLDLSLESLPVERALGMKWCIESDQFHFHIVIQDQPATRRGILSTVASVFDPLGLIAPFILKGKQILQEICRAGCGWNDPLPEEIVTRWDDWRSQLPGLASMSVPRCYRPRDFGEAVETQLHHFSDASTTGYGQCTYIREINKDSRVHCSLVMGKSRVVPLRPITIPRLELQAAVTSVRISNLLNHELDSKNISNHYWTDSQVVLAYLNNEARRFHVYVANRVQKIRESTSIQKWRYVHTKDNPADHASRGLDADELENSSWFRGPPFLWEEKMPADEQSYQIPSGDPEVKMVKALSTISKMDRPGLEILERFSDWRRAAGVISLIQQYLRRRRGHEPESPEAARQRAERWIIKSVQEDAFHEELVSLRKGDGRTDSKPIKKESSLFRLDPFVDREDMLRVGGRLSKSNLPMEVKHPLILPKGSHVTKLVIKYYHELTAHQGRGMTINNLRNNGFWIIGCRTAVSSFLFQWILCRRLRGKAQIQKMADLPEDRVQEAHPFTYCGMDCFGPFLIKEGRKTIKRYGVIFTCMALRAVHLEVLEDMTADAFINCLRCFISIRGQVRTIRCDQGSNFVGAKNELKTALDKLDEGKLKDMLLRHNCDFVFNTPASSHMGGVWERQIGSVKRVLAGLLATSENRMSTSSLRTFLYEAMAIVNSRPLTVDNHSNANDLIPLTPNQLLTMKTKIILPPPGSFVKEDAYARKRWRQVQYMSDQFWKRWRVEYLQTLQTRQKWLQNQSNLKKGDVVILKDEDVPRGHWNIARISETIEAQDGCVRKVRILMGEPNRSKIGKRMGKPVFLDRPIHKLILLIRPEEK